MICVTHETGILEINHSLLRADHSSRGMLPNVVCLECGREAWIMRRLWTNRACCAGEERGGNNFFSKLNTKCS
jgi:hypothetical protein